MEGLEVTAAKAVTAVAGRALAMGAEMVAELCIKGTMATWHEASTTTDASSLRQKMKKKICKLPRRQRSLQLRRI